MRLKLLPQRLRQSLKKQKHLPSLLVTVVVALVKLLRRTYRTELVDPIGLLATGQPWPIIVAIWHNRMLFTADFFPRHLRHQAVALASASRDGEYAAAFIARFLGGVVRGSSSRGGARALRALRHELEHGRTVVLTVDGPRGPRYQVQAGTVALARQTGIPIVPISVNASRRWELKGWDGTQIPKPFSHVKCVIGEPLFFKPGVEDAATASIENDCEKVRQALLAITDDKM